MPINKKLVKEIMVLPYRGLPVGGRERTPPPSPVAALLLGLTDPEEERGKASTSIEVWTFVSNTGLDMLIPESNWRRVFWCVFFNSMKMTKIYRSSGDFTQEAEEK